jgi:predicted metalloprotease with PDZ domain
MQAFVTNFYLSNFLTMKYVISFSYNAIPLGAKKSKTYSLHNIYRKIIYLLLFVFVNNVAAQSLIEWNIDLSKKYQQGTPIKISVQGVKPETLKLNFVTEGFGVYKKVPITQLIKNLKAFDKNGKQLSINYIAPSSYRIENANRMAYLQYNLQNIGLSSNQYQAALSQVQLPDFAILNAIGAWGYFDGYENAKCIVKVQKPPKLVGSSGLVMQRGNSIDVFEAANFEQLYESTLFYASPDTASFVLRGTRFGVYYQSLNNRITSKELSNWLQPVVDGVGEMLGSFPVSSYNFQLLFVSNQDTTIKIKHYGGRLGGAAAFVVLPDMANKTQLKKVVQRIATHELLHLLLPYSLRSNNTPALVYNHQNTSPHTWLYEGATEYLSLLVLLRSNVISEKDFWADIARKIDSAEHYPPVSLWQLSSHLTKNRYQRVYNMVYSKGALTAMALDVEINRQSGGKNDLIKVLLQLANSYGHSKYFDDKQWLNEFIGFTSPQTEQFWQRYIKQKCHSCNNEWLSMLGKQYYTTHKEVVGSFGVLGWFPDYKLGKMQLVRVGENTLGLKNGDVLLSINGNDVTTGNYVVWQDLLFRPQPKQLINVQIERQKQLIELSTIAEPFVRTRKKVIVDVESNKEQTNELKNWVLNR